MGFKHHIIIYIYIYAGFDYQNMGMQLIHDGLLLIG